MGISSGNFATDAQGRQSQGAAPAGSAAVVEVSNGSAAIADSALLVHGHYARVGSDLVLRGEHGEVVVVHDYFLHDPLPDLHGPGNQVMPAALVQSLTPSASASQVAAAGAAVPAGAVAIGTVKKLTGEVTVIHKDGTTSVLHEGDAVYQGDILQTGADGSVGIVFVDNTDMSLGAKGRLVLDEMIFDPGNGQGQASFSLVSGAFSFVSGQIAKSSPDGVAIKTPVATIGIRGTSGVVEIGGQSVGADDQIKIVLVPDPDGAVGEILVTTSDGRSTTINTAFSGLSVAPTGTTTFTMTAQEFVRDYGHYMSSLSSDFHQSLPGLPDNQPGQQQQQQQQEQQQPDGNGKSLAPVPEDGQKQSGTDSRGENGNGETPAIIRVTDTGAVLRNLGVSGLEVSGSSGEPSSSSGSSGGSAGTGGSGSHAGESDGAKGTTSSQEITEKSSTDNSLTGSSGSSGSSSGSSGGGTSGDTSTGTGGSSGETGSSSSSSGKVIDPYVYSATVFLDYDHDRILDDNEPWVHSDSTGAFSLYGNLSTIVSLGGVDASSGANVGLMMTFAGGTVISPLTTLMVMLVEGGMAANAAAAQSLLASMFGLNLTGIDLTTYDPVAGSSSSGQGVAILAAGMMVQDTLKLVTALLQGAGASESAARLAAWNAMVTMTGRDGGAFFLNDRVSVEEMVRLAASDPAVAGNVNSAAVENGLAAAATLIVFTASEFETVIDNPGSGGMPASLLGLSNALQTVASSVLLTAAASGSTPALSNISLPGLAEWVAENGGGSTDGGSGSSSGSGTTSPDAGSGTSGGGASGNGGGTTGLSLTGTAGDDTLTGGSGNDTIDGAAGNDTINGGTGDDTLLGGAGADTLVSSSGSDVLDGGEGDDTADFSGRQSAISVQLKDSTYTWSINEVQHSGTISSIKTVIGTAYNDYLAGTTQVDVLSGGAGNDTLDGYGGSDTLIGGAGDDTIYYTTGANVQGGTGTDTMKVLAASATGVVDLRSLGFTGIDVIEVAPSNVQIQLNSTTVDGSDNHSLMLQSASGSSGQTLVLTSDWELAQQLPVVIDGHNWALYQYTGADTVVRTLLVDHSIQVSYSDANSAPQTATDWVYANSMYTDPGWADGTNDGLWAWGTGSGSAPATGVDGGSYLCSALSGDSSSLGSGEWYLVSEEFDVSSVNGGVSISFYRSLDLAGSDDSARLEYSTDGGSTWSWLWDAYGTSYNDGGNWVKFSTSLTAGDLQGASTLMLRWTVASANSDGYGTGWCIDNLLVSSLYAPTNLAEVATSADPAVLLAASMSVSNLIGGAGDADGDALGVAIVGTETGSSLSYYYYSLDNGVTWTVLPSSLDETSAIVLGGSALLAFVPDGTPAGNETLTWKIWDGTDGSISGQTGVDTTAGSNSFSVDVDVIKVKGDNTSPGFVEDGEGTPGHIDFINSTIPVPFYGKWQTSVGDLARDANPQNPDAPDRYQDQDATDTSWRGYAITGLTGNGTWSYTLNGGTTWVTIDPGVLSTTHALLLGEGWNGNQVSLKFVPTDISIPGNVTYTIVAWDGTDSGVAGTYGDTTGGGSAGSAYSLYDATVTVTPGAYDTWVGGAGEVSMVNSVEWSTGSLPDISGATDIAFYSATGEEFVIGSGTALWTGDLTLAGNAGLTVATGGSLIVGTDQFSDINIAENTSLTIDGGSLTLHATMSMGNADFTLVKGSVNIISGYGLEANSITLLDGSITRSNTYAKIAADAGGTSQLGSALGGTYEYSCTGNTGEGDTFLNISNGASMQWLQDLAAGEYISLYSMNGLSGIYQMAYKTVNGNGDMTLGLSDITGFSAVTGDSWELVKLHSLTLGVNMTLADATFTDIVISGSMDITVDNATFANAVSLGNNALTLTGHSVIGNDWDTLLAFNTISLGTNTEVVGNGTHVSDYSVIMHGTSMTLDSGNTLSFHGYSAGQSMTAMVESSLQVNGGALEVGDSSMVHIDGVVTLATGSMVNLGTFASLELDQGLTTSGSASMALQSDSTVVLHGASEISDLTVTGTGTLMLESNASGTATLKLADSSTLDLDPDNNGFGVTLHNESGVITNGNAETGSALINGDYISGSKAHIQISYLSDGGSVTADHLSITGGSQLAGTLDVTATLVGGTPVLNTATTVLSFGAAHSDSFDHVTGLDAWADSNAIILDLQSTTGSGSYAEDMTLTARAVTVSATSGDDVKTGTSGDDVIYGGAGNDTLSGGADGRDLVYGGDGNDTIIFNSGNTIGRYDGGDGYDTLVVSSNVDFTTLNGELIDGFERIDLKTDTNAQSIILDAGTIEGLTGGGGSNTLLIDGGATADTVNLDAGWTYSGSSTDVNSATGYYHTYTNSDSGLSLVVTSNMQVNIA